MRGNEVATSALAAGDHNRASNNRRPTGNSLDVDVGCVMIYVVGKIVKGAEAKDGRLCRCE